MKALPFEVYAHLAGQISSNVALSNRLALAASSDNYIADQLFQIVEDSVFLVLTVKIRDDAELLNEIGFRSITISEFVKNTTGMDRLLDILSECSNAFKPAIIIQGSTITMDKVPPRLWDKEPVSMQTIKDFYDHMSTIIPYVVDTMVLSLPNRYYDILTILKTMVDICPNNRDDIESAIILHRMYTIKADIA